MIPFYALHKHETAETQDDSFIGVSNMSVLFFSRWIGFDWTKFKFSKSSYRTEW